MFAKYQFFLHFLLSVSFLSKNVSSLGVKEGNFCYMGEGCDHSSTEWGGLCQSGHWQSPINIPPQVFNIFPQVCPIKFSEKYFDFQENYWLLNNGHTMIVLLAPNRTSDHFVSGYDLDGDYNFAQIHFHWGVSGNKGSEHFIDSENYPMEIHLVHYSTKYESLFEAIESTNDPKALVVFGVFAQLSKNGTKPNQNQINRQSVFENFDEIQPREKSKEFQGTISLSWFLPFFERENVTNQPDTFEYFKYQGSLTTPPCTQNVFWVVFKEPIYIEQNTLDTFQSILDFKNITFQNHRPLQPIGSRVVQHRTINYWKDKLINDDLADITNAFIVKKLIEVN